MSGIKYYFVLASENFLFNEEPLEEVLRERVQNYNKQNKPLNFWIVPNPEFLQNSELSKFKKESPQNPVAIVSTNKTFIVWLKLRLNHVLSGSLTITDKKQISPLKFLLKH